MAQDSRKALDEKTRKLSSGRIEDGKEHAAYQEAQQQLLAIQAEQQQNLAVARAESKANFDNTQTLAQAAEIGALSAAEAEQNAIAGSVSPQLNPATQAVLSKYGVGQPKFMKAQSQNQQVTKQNITINNNTTVNTTNDVKVPANTGGPIQGRPLAFKSPGNQDSTGKFRSWISSTLARQNEEGARRDREYRNREASLTKSAGRMMRKLEEVGKTIGSRMDPRKIGSTWQSQLKTLMFLFGFGYLTSNWTNILDKVGKVEEWIEKTYDYFKKGDFITDIKSFIGGDENESLIEAFGKLLGNEGLFGYIKEYFNSIYKDRAQAVKEIKFPDIDTGSITNTLKSLGEYLGDLFGAIVGGTESVKKTVARQAEKESLNQSMANYRDKGRTATTATKTIGDYKGDKGALALVDGSYKGLTAYSIDKNGNLDKSNLTEATLASSSEISRINEKVKSGDISQTGALAQQLYRLYNTAKETNNNYVAVTKDFLKLFSKDELKDLTSKKMVVSRPYRIIYHEKTQDDWDNREDLNAFNRAADMFATQSAVNKLGGRVAGLATGNYATAIGGSWGAPVAAATEYLATSADKFLANKGRFTFARSNYILKPGEHDTGETENLYEVSPQVIKQAINRLSNKKLDESNNADDKASIQRVINQGSIDVQTKKLNEIKKKTQEKLDEENSKSTDYQANSIRPYQLEQKLRLIDEAKDYLYSQNNTGYVWADQALDRLNKGKAAIDQEYQSSIKDNRAVTLGRNLKNATINTINSGLNLVGLDLNSITNSLGSTEAPIIRQKDNHGAAGMAKTYDSKNPGNYKGTMFSNGERDSFSKGKGRDHAKFDTWEQGYAGNAWQLLMYLTGKSSHTEKNPTLRKVIKTWVGPHVSESHLQDYSRDSGLPLDSPLKANADTLYRLALTIGKWDSSHKVNKEAEVGVAMALNEWKKKGYSLDEGNGNYYKINVQPSQVTNTEKSNQNDENNSEKESKGVVDKGVDFLKIFTKHITDMIFGGGEISENVKADKTLPDSKIPLDKQLTEQEITTKDKLKEAEAKLEEKAGSVDNVHVDLKSSGLTSVMMNADQIIEDAKLGPIGKYLRSINDNLDVVAQNSVSQTDLGKLQVKIGAQQVDTTIASTSASQSNSAAIIRAVNQSGSSVRCSPLMSTDKTNLGDYG